MNSDYAISAAIPTRTADGETVASLIERLARLEAQYGKWEDEGKALVESILSAKQQISRAIKVLDEALGGQQKASE